MSTAAAIKFAPSSSLNGVNLKWNEPNTLYIHICTYTGNRFSTLNFTSNNGQFLLKLTWLALMPNLLSQPTCRMHNLLNYYGFYETTHIHTGTHTQTLNNCHLLVWQKISNSWKQTNVPKRSLSLHNLKFEFQMDFSSSFPGVNQCISVRMCVCLRM